jgi:hypothetical protein
MGRSRNNLANGLTPTTAKKDCLEQANGEAQRRQTAFASSPEYRFRPLPRSVRLLGTHQTDYLYAIAALQGPAKCKTS